MKIFTDSSDSIVRELDTIKDSFGITKFKAMKDNIERLESFSELLYQISGTKDEESKRILEKFDKYKRANEEARLEQFRKRIKNFISDKDFHNSFSGKVIKAYQKRDFNYYRDRRLYLDEEQMLAIICDFLDSEFNQADEFRRMAFEGKILRFNLDSFEDKEMAAGETVFNHLTRNNFIITAPIKLLADADLMRTLAHEFGHVADNIDKRFASVKDISNYAWVSSYVEVYSLLYERLFLDYLIKNNLFKEDALSGLKEYYTDIYDQFNSIRYLSNLDDYLLTNLRYKSKKGIINQIEIDEAGEFIMPDGVYSDFADANKYSYSGVIANYFATLKHEDPEMFKKAFETFKRKRFDRFNPSIFEDIGTNPDEIIKVLEKGTTAVSTKKKLILE